MPVPLSILDLVPVGEGTTVGDSLRASVRLARHAEEWGYRRIWYAEHHNMPAIGSSAPAVVIAHVGAHTSSIRLGAGGVMLPNHAPLTVAEQYGTLAEMYPGRIDLGVGRAPGTDQQTFLALRRDPAAAERFPHDVLELQGYLSGESRVPGVQATPGRGTNVPLYVLGSSLFGAQLAAALGLPYAFASHFAPAALQEAVAIYRREFRPSPQLPEPYVIAGVNVVAAGTRDEADAQFQAAKQRRVRLFFGRDRALSAEEVERILASPQGAHVLQMVRYTAVGTPDEVAAYLDRFAEHAGADELMLAPATPDREAELDSYRLVAEAVGLARAA